MSSILLFWTNPTFHLVKTYVTMRVRKILKWTLISEVHNRKIVPFSEPFLICSDLSLTLKKSTLFWVFSDKHGNTLRKSGPPGFNPYSAPFFQKRNWPNNYDWLWSGCTKPPSLSYDGVMTSYYDSRLQGWSRDITEWEMGSFRHTARVVMTSYYDCKDSRVTSLTLQVVTFSYKLGVTSPVALRSPVGMTLLPWRVWQH